MTKEQKPGRCRHCSLDEQTQAQIHRCRIRFGQRVEAYPCYRRKFRKGQAPTVRTGRLRLPEGKLIDD